MTAVAQLHARLKLHIGAQQTVVSTMDSVQGFATAGPISPAVCVVLELGFEQIANLHFKRDIPTPLELEHAIQTVEDQVVRARTQVAPGTWLASSDANLHKIAAAAHGHSTRPAVLTLEDVEHTFNRLAAVSLGRPAASERLPIGKSFAASLLILREFMHHLQCPGLHVS
jgi:exopolyphosphatase/pppGpp-phosphohydrolase